MKIKSATLPDLLCKPGEGKDDLSGSARGNNRCRKGSPGGG